MSILIEDSIYILSFFVFEVYKINLKIIENVKCKLFYSYFNLLKKKLTKCKWKYFVQYYYKI